MNTQSAAFPVQSDTDPFNSGLRMLDYFAAAAMQGMITRMIEPSSTGNTNLKWAEARLIEPEMAACKAYAYAKACLAEREKHL